MSDHNEPDNNAVKPGLSTSEGKIAAFVVLVTTLGPVFAALAGALPDNPYVQIAVAVLAALTTILTTLGYIKKRSDIKETANEVAGALAHADRRLAFVEKAAAVVKEHPELAAALLKSAGVTPPDSGTPLSPASK